MGLRLLTFTALIFSYAFAGKIEALAIGPVAIVLLSFIARQSPGNTVSSIKAPLILVLTMSPFLALTPGTEMILRIGLLSIYRESLILLGTITFRSLCIFAFLSIAINGTESYKLASCLKRIGIPGKLIIILLSTWRYINLYIADLRQLMTSARLRGFSLTKGLSHGAVSADILLTLLIRSYEQSERVQAAMMIRGFTGDFAVRNGSSPPTGRDLALSGTALIVTVIIIALEIIC